MSGGSGQLALGVVGAVVGSFVGAPQLGFVLGSFAGSLLFPPKIPGVEGPRLSDLKGQTSQYGRPMPIAFGSYRMAGNVTWCADIREVENTESQGGKGGPKQSFTSFAYYGSWQVLLTDCKAGPIDGIRRIWDTVTGKLLYDVGATASLTSLVKNQTAFGGAMTVYTGTSDQQPDPTMESYLGVGNVSGYRYRSHVVFNNMALEQFSNRIPNLEFEVVRSGTTTQYFREAVNTATISGLQAINNPQYVDGIFSFDAILNTTYTTRRYSFDLTGALVEVQPTQFSFTNFYGDQDDGTQGVILGTLGGTAEFPVYVTWLVEGSGEIGSLMVGDIPVMTRHYITDSNGTQYNLKGAALNATQDRLFVFYKHEGVERWREYDADLNILRDYERSAITLGDAVLPAPVVSAQPLICGMSRSADGSRGCFTVESDNSHLWHFRAASITSQRFCDLYYIEDDGTFTLLKSFTGASEEGPSGNALSGAIAADNGVAMGMVSIGTVVLWSRLPRFDDNVVTLSDVVTELCTRKNFDDEITLSASDINVTALTDDVIGYAFTKQAPARTGLDQLAQAFFFDAVESDGKIKFVKRGGASVVTIPDDDLAARRDGESEGDAISITRQQEVEVPSEVTVLFPDIDNSHQIAVQSSRRVGHVSGSPMQVQIPVVMDAEQAKQISDVLRFDALTAKDAYSFTTGIKYAAYEPTDTLYVDDRLLRITQKDESPDGVISWMCSAEDSDGYSKSYPAAAWSAPGAELSLSGPTTFHPLDIPLLRDSDEAGYGFYGVARSFYSGWPGAILYKSTDNGASYGEVSPLLVAGYVGYATTVLGAPDQTYATFDEVNSVTIALPSGASLSSMTEAQLLANPNDNAVLIGDEILRYKTVIDNADNTYTLSGFLRGLRGTEWASSEHALDDRAVLLNLNELAHIPGGLTEINQSRNYRAITLGSADGAAQAFTNTGVAEKPYAPVHVVGAYDSINAWTLRWCRRTRVGGEWRDNADAAISEDTEEYKVEIMSGDTVLRTITGITDEEYSYPDATAVTDFGSSPSQINFRVSQLSGAVGYGYAGSGVATKSGSYPAVVLAKSPVAYWHLNELTGTFIDVVGGYNSTTESLNARGEPSLVAGGDKCVKFSAASPQQIAIDTSLPQFGATWSFEAWIKLTTISGHQGIFVRDTTAWVSGFPAFFFKASEGSDGKPTIGLSYAVGSAVTAKSPDALATNTVYHIVATCDNTNLVIYVNGVAKNTTATAGRVLPIQTGAPVLGAGMFNDAVVDRLAGWLDEVAVYNYALSASEVAANYAAG